MTTDERFISTIRAIVDSTGAVGQILRIPRFQLEQALELLSDPASVEAAKELLRHALELHRTRLLPPNNQARTQIAQRAESADWEAGLRRLLQDQGKLPTVGAIQDFVRSAFGLNVPNRKRGRDPYVRSVINRIKLRPKALSKVQAVLSDGDAKGDKAYEQLYGFIRGRTGGG